MKALFYAVLTTLPTEAKAREYVAWLNGGHLAAVIAGGASRGNAVVLDRAEGLAAGAVQVLTHYVFPCREVFATYERDHAPSLRAEGRAKFGAETGVVMQRMLGEVVG